MPVLNSRTAFLDFYGWLEVKKLYAATHPDRVILNSGSPMAKSHDMAASGLLPSAVIFSNKQQTGWEVTRGEAYASSQWKPSSSSEDAESFVERLSPVPNSYDPWRASEPMQKGYPSMTIEGEWAPPHGTVFPAQLSNCTCSAPSFALPATSFSPLRMAANRPSSFDAAALFEACVPFKSSSSASFNTYTTTSFDPCGPYGPAFGSSDSSETSCGSTSPFESYYPYDSPPFISSASHDSSDQEYGVTLGILDRADEHIDPSAPFLYTQDEETLSCSQNSQLDYPSRSMASARCQEEAGHCSTVNDHQSHWQSQIRPPRMPVEPVTKSRKALKKPYACFPCGKWFERHEHLTRHKLTMTHRKTLKDRGLPCFDPPPQMTACPFCPRKFNRSDNLKPHMLTHMHLAGENKRNAPISIEDSVRSGQAKIDPRLKPIMDAKKKVAPVRSLLKYEAGRNR